MQHTIDTMSTTIKCLVFDFDNTIVKNVESTDFQILNIIKKYNPFTSDGQLLKIIQAATTDYEICEKLVPHCDIESVYAQILLFNMENVKKIYYSPQIIELILNLYNHYQLNIISGRDHSSLVYSLQKQGIKNYFKEIIGSDSNFKAKPSPDSLNYIINKYNFIPSEVVFIGDSITDYMAGNQAGCHFIHVSWYSRKMDSDTIVSCNTPQAFMDILTLFPQ